LFNKFYLGAATLAKRAARLANDIKVKVFYMSGGISKSHKISNGISSSMLYEFSIEADLPHIDIPVLLIGGEFDIYIDSVKIGVGRQSRFNGRIITMDGETKNGSYPTTFGLIGNSRKDIYIIPSATHILSFSHPYHCCWYSAYFLHKYCKGRIDYQVLKKVMRMSRGRK